jgi:hypothetical protein
MCISKMSGGEGGVYLGRDFDGGGKGASVTGPGDRRRWRRDWRESEEKEERK